MGSRAANPLDKQNTVGKGNPLPRWITNPMREKMVNGWLHSDCGFQAKKNTRAGLSSKRKWIIRPGETDSTLPKVQRFWGPREGLESGPECPPLPLLLFHHLPSVDLLHSLHSTWLCVCCSRHPETTYSRSSSPPSTLDPNSKLQGRDLIGPAWVMCPLIQPAVAWGRGNIPWYGPCE